MRELTEVEFGILLFLGILDGALLGGVMGWLGYSVDRLLIAGVCVGILNAVAAIWVPRWLKRRHG